MAMHKTNGLLKYGLVVVAVMGMLILLLKSCHRSGESVKMLPTTQHTMKNSASNDNAAESLDTLTAELSTTKQQVTQITKDNDEIKKQNAALIKQLKNTQDTTTASLTSEVAKLKEEMQHPKFSDYTVNTGNSTQPIATVPDLTQSSTTNKLDLFGSNKSASSNNKSKLIPYYTIPANSTAVRDRLMSSLVGRIPVKSVVTDPYPFKLVFSDDTLAANGFRVPHLLQMIVGGYAEGDLNMQSVRGWVTSLTFVFDDGAIFNTTSNDNDIGHFTKENALGYLSDKYGNPFIRGKLITNAPAYLTTSALLGASKGMANAYSQEQTTNQTTALGTTTSSVTGSSSKYVAGQAGVGAIDSIQQWWNDREAQSFDAIFVPTVDEKGNPIEIAVNFTKEIDIDYNPEGRKIDYAHTNNANVSRRLD